MKILFMGTPDIAAVCLGTLLADGFEIVGAVTQPDKPKGRGHKLMPPEVKVLAEQNQIPVFQPETLKNGELQPVLEKTQPDLIAVVAYGKLLPEYVLNFPKKGCINMHASLLPKYRGAAPIQWSVINGEEKTGVTTMLMDKGLDTGDMLLSKELTIGTYETSAALFERIAVLGAEVLSETIRRIDEIKPVAQNHEDMTYAPMISKEMGHIDWTKPAFAVSKLICGMNSWPLAYTIYEDQPVKIHTAKIAPEQSRKGTPGEILEYEKKKGLLVQCGEGCLYIEELQFPGKKKMHIDDYLLGHTIKTGTILE